MIENLQGYSELNPAEKDDRDKVLKRKIRQIFQEFSVHGLEQNGKFISRADLDGMGCMALLLLAGIKADKTQYVPQGEYRYGAVTADSGDQEGVVYTEGDDKPSLIIDHHGGSSKPGSSATLYFYNLLKEMGVIRDRKEPYIGRLVEFVNSSDNAKLPDNDNYFVNPNYHRTLLGLRNFIRRPNDLVRFFRDGHDILEVLTDADLEKYGFIFSEKRRDGKKVTRDRSTEVQKNILLSRERIDDLEKRGFTINTSGSGKIIVDYRADGGMIKGGFPAAKAAGYDGYVIWNPKEQSFFASSTKPFKFTEVKDGVIKRQTMWMKEKKDTSELKITLKDILDNLAGGSYEAQGELKELFEK